MLCSPCKILADSERAARVPPVAQMMAYLLGKGSADAKAEATCAGSAVSEGETIGRKGNLSQGTGEESG
jgi:hypothetical protein